MHRKPIFYLILGTLLLGGGWLLQRFAGDYYTSQAYFAYRIQENLEHELAELEYDMIPVLDTISTNQILKFGSYNESMKYPYFIYRKGELKLWSHAHFVPEYELIEGDYSIKVVNLNKNIFLARKWLADTGAGQYEIVSLLPIYINYPVQNKYLSNNANKAIFSRQEIEVIMNPQEDDVLPIILRNKIVFWLAKDQNFKLESSPFNISLLIIYSLALLMFIVAGVRWAFQKTTSYGKWILLLAIFLIWAGLKIIMNLFDFPNSLLGTKLFDSRFFAVSWFEHSFGDMMLNTIMIFLLSFVIFRYYRIADNQRLSNTQLRLLVATAIVFLLNLVINYQYLQLRTIYFNSQISLDITQSLTFDRFKILSILVFLLLSLSTVLLFHLLFKRLEIQVTNNKERVLAIVLGSLLFVLFTFGANLPVANLLGVTTIILIILFVTKIHQSLQRASNAITLYILFWIIIESALGGWCIADFENTRDTNKMVRYAQNLASKNDFMAEFMIAEVVNAINNDPSISARMRNPFLSKDYIIKKIRRGYMNKYLNKYNTAIYLYSASGEGIPGFGTTLNYFEIKERYGLESNRTEFEDIFILTQDFRSLSKHYMAFLHIKRYGNVIGHIVLDFRQKRLVPQNVYPELLVDNRFIEYQSSEYSYGVFEDDFLIQSSGDMDYNVFNIKELPDQNPWVENGYKHYWLTSAGGDTIVVSRKTDFLRKVLSNTSFLLTTLILPIIILLSLYLIYQLNRGRQISYNVKIQLFLYLAFFIPLALVTITTLSFITNSFRQELVEGKLRESNRLAEQIETETDAYLVNLSAKDLLTDKIMQLANYGHFDATVYGTDGMLITTTQPDIFSSGLQSFYLNPKAFVSLIENSETNIVDNETIGSLNYYSIYSAIRSHETNRLLGVLSIPFFRAESTIESNQIEALTTILNVFILIFVLALLATFQTSKWLTTPLLLIRQRMGQTSFSGENKPIKWDADDEIGKLIGEYNNMLIKLEASKEALARSQKESAWREVAQQVAHEIKNPLTPMKLTLQKLEQAVNKDYSQNSRQIAATVKNLLNQLQMLNDIVTSFSDFAKMPIPKNEKMNLARVLQELKTFFESEEHIDLKLQLHAEEVYILADHKLMNRILSNVIINASQSRKEGQEVVEVVITTARIKTENSIQIKIQDNGTGIASDVVDRVFIPRFSTKDEGSGIGLAVAKHGIEHAGGTIWFETEWGKGTTFYLQLPDIS
jgi:signal transduction histidine kinase